MVLWEITLATAYFLGLKRTYRLALRIQRRLISPKHPKIRQFAHSRIRTVFDVALKVHYKLQQRDIEVGRNVGNWILRWLDRLKPSAQIRAPPSEQSSTTKITKQVTNSTPPNQKVPQNQDSDRHHFASYQNTWSKPIASISMIRRVPKTLSGMTQYRHIYVGVPSHYTRSGSVGVFRPDIVEWMQRG